MKGKLGPAGAKDTVATCATSAWQCQHYRLVPVAQGSKRKSSDNRPQTTTDRQGVTSATTPFPALQALTRLHTQGKGETLLVEGVGAPSEQHSNKRNSKEDSAALADPR